MTLTEEDINSAFFFTLESALVQKCDCFQNKFTQHSVILCPLLSFWLLICIGWFLFYFKHCAALLSQLEGTMKTTLINFFRELAFDNSPNLILAPERCFCLNKKIKNVDSFKFPATHDL